MAVNETQTVVSKTNHRSRRRVSLARTFFVAAFISIALAEIFWLIPIMLMREQKLYEEVERRARIAVVAMIEETRFEDIAMTKRIGERLMAIGDIKGAAIYDRFGNRINEFGEAPVLSWIGATKENIKRLKDPTHCCLDMHIPPEESNFSEHLILRLDTTEARNALWAYVASMAWTIFIVATVTCAACVLQLYFWVAKPLKKLAISSLKAAAKPWQADEYQITLKRNDEMGDLSYASNVLFKTVSDLYRNEFNVAKQLLAKTEHAVMEFTTEGELIRANPIALQLFKASSIQEIKKRPPLIFRCPRLNSNKPIDVTRLMSEKNIVECGFLLTEKEEIRCVFSGTIITNIKDGLTHYAIMILPADQHHEEIAQLNNELQAVQQQVIAVKVRSAENTLQNEAARTLVHILNNKFENEASKNQHPVPCDCVEILTNWNSKVKKTNLNVKLEFPKKIPAIMGNPKVLKTLFEQAVILVYLRSEFSAPVIAITAQKANKKKNTMFFSMTDISNQFGRSYLPKNASRQNAEVSLKTLEKLLPMANASIQSGMTSNLTSNEVVIAITVDETEMSLQSENA